jgi:hypothetical protein
LKDDIEKDVRKMGSSVMDWICVVSTTTQLSGVSLLDANCFIAQNSSQVVDATQFVKNVFNFNEFGI